MAATQSRYLGVQPFKTSDKHIFFGRDERYIACYFAQTL